MPAGQTAEEALPQVIARLVERVQAEAPGEEGPILLTVAFVLTGLRVSRERLIGLFQGVRTMRESTAYQVILDEGRIEEARKLLLKLGRKHLGEPEAVVEATVRAIQDLDRLELLAERITEVQNWQDLLATP